MHLGNVDVSSKAALISNDGLTLSRSPLLPLSPLSPLRQPLTPFRAKTHSITERMCIEKDEHIDPSYCGRYTDIWRISKRLGGYKASWPLHQCHRAVIEHEHNHFTINHWFCAAVGYSKVIQANFRLFLRVHQSKEERVILENVIQLT